MTIDEMLDQIAEREGVKPSAPMKTAASRKSAKSCSGGCSSYEGHRCSCGGGKSNASDMALDLEKAKLIARGVEIAAQKMNVRVVVAVDNNAANLVLLHAMDDSYIASIEASQKKAYTAAALKMPTHTALKESRGGSLDGYTNGGNILMLGGGYPLEISGRILGSIGVSGGTKEQDILLAQIGAELFRRL